jgi:outer membrane receptor protein involved in Fe transport
MTWLAAAMLAPASGALAQAPASAPPARPAASAAQAVEGITVTAPSNGMRTSIDRRSYSIADDLQTSTGSLADALKNVPSLEVDVQGNVSLRGDSSVEILVDGKPSGLFRGEGRADALQQLGADQIERVEVITNPSAAYRPDGSGGVINLITKKGRGAGGSGSVRGNLSDNGRYNLGASGAYNSNKLTVTGDAGVRHNKSKFTSVDQRSRLDPGAGAFVDSRQDLTATGDGDSWNVRASADYDPNEKTRISGEVRYNASEQTAQNFEHYEEDRASGGPSRIVDRLGVLSGERNNAQASTSFRRQFDGEGHELVVDASFERTEDDRRRSFSNVQPVPAIADLYEDIRYKGRGTEKEGQVEYTRPMPGDGKLKAGYAFDLDQDDFDNFGFRGGAPDALVSDPLLNNRFKYREQIHALYSTYEQSFGAVSALAGLRFEEVDTVFNQVTQARRVTGGYSRLYPSLHLGYRFSDTQQFTASYSHRVRRPNASDLNPFRVYQDPFNYREGNPRLEPQETHSLEAGYQYRREGAYYLATAYYRESYKGVTDVVRDLGDGVFLTTKENLGESRSGGLELTANGRLAPKLSFNINGNVYWNEIDASRLGFTEPRSAFAYGGRANLNWQATERDIFQINGFARGKQLTPQGYRRPSGMLNLGWRHKWDDRLSFVATAQDVLKSAKDEVVIDTPILRSRVERRMNAQAVFVGFTYAFGGNTRRQPGRESGFEFDQGPAPEFE